ncbi:Zn-dependent metalloprotease [Butyrivibrio proteoclasticus]|uniref:Zn-dependent metalloprotease n=1 Tax=Butyrivibrio proteoclasticus TaxID=43305 RepID=A0A1I5S3J9_9FIRM|nr:M4 family metallopeptidase [Butyrivibrio proteoclasticus]SFP65310.1 Zn-dependent metalloprotease [Butyrivibrio proteoclasticus]
MSDKHIISKIVYFIIPSLIISACGSSVDEMAVDAISSEEAFEEMASEEDSEYEEDYKDEYIYDFELQDKYCTKTFNAENDADAQEVFNELNRINGDSLKIVTNKYGYITFMQGTICEEPCLTPEDYDKVMEMIRPAISYDKEIDLEQYFLLVDDFGNTYVVFKEKQGESINESNVVKLILDKDGYMKGISSTIIPYSDSGENTVEPAVALEVVKEFLSENNPDVSYVFYTDEPELEIRRRSDNVTGQEYTTKVYTVFTDNPYKNLDAYETPCIEHYVSRDGKYIGNRPVYVNLKDDGKRELSGIESLFDAMDETSFTDTYVNYKGKSFSVTVPIAKKGQTYYLQDKERKIICADYWEFKYNNEVKVISSSNNKDWDPQYIKAYNNYVKCYDFYADEGWYGPDGVGGPILLLMDYCDEQHNPIDNLSYLGQAENAQIFAACSKANVYSDAIDVVTHEYTHGVTSAALTDIIYKNEMGAINEGISDIMGEIADLYYEEKEGIESSEKALFYIGEDAGQPLRDLCIPEAFGQPSRVGSVFYVPSATIPADFNDLGGVHINSSLIGNAFFQMYIDSDLTANELLSIWFSLIYAMTPGTGFFDISEMLPFACRLSGNDEVAKLAGDSINNLWLNTKDYYEYIDVGTSQILFVLPPWIDWSRTRLEMIDKTGMVFMSWPEKGRDTICLDVYPGEYYVQLSQFDVAGNMIGCWNYNGEKWTTKNENARYITIENEELYMLNELPYIQN